MENIKIMGGGLSGLTAAINLVKAGYNVDVFEKRSDCGKRFHGDLEGLENWSSPTNIINELKSMNIKINFDCDPFKTIHASNGKEIIENTCKKPVFYLVKRGAIKNNLYQGLKKQALDAGINIHFNSLIQKKYANVISTRAAENKPVGIVKGLCFEIGYNDISVVLPNSLICITKTKYAYMCYS